MNDWSTNKVIKVSQLIGFLLMKLTFGANFSDKLICDLIQASAYTNLCTAIASWLVHTQLQCKVAQASLLQYNSTSYATYYVLLSSILRLSHCTRGIPLLFSAMYDHRVVTKYYVLSWVKSNSQSAALFFTGNYAAMLLHSSALLALCCSSLLLAGKFCFIHSL